MGISIETEVNAKKQTFADEEAWKVIEAAEKVIVASGKKIIEFVPKNAEKDELLKKITGRTGNLRAPTLQLGNIFYVGYNDELYKQLS